MSLKHMYLLLCFVGAALPLSQFIPWLFIHGFAIPLFFNDLLINGISRFFVFDVIISAIVLIIFILAEGKRLGLEKSWLSIAATLCVGVSLGLPLFLYQRQVKLDTIP